MSKRKRSRVEETGDWLSLVLLTLLGAALLAVLWQVGQSVGQGIAPGLVLLALVSLACRTLLVVARLLRSGDDEWKRWPWL